MLMSVPCGSTKCSPTQYAPFSSILCTLHTQYAPFCGSTVPCKAKLGLNIKVHKDFFLQIKNKQKWYMGYKTGRSVCAENAYCYGLCCAVTKTEILLISS